MDEGTAAPMNYTEHVYRLWWPIRLAFWFVGGVSDVSLMVGFVNHPEKPMMFSLVDSRNISRGYGNQIMSIASARQWANRVLQLCDQYETFRQKISYLPQTEPNPGPEAS